jgi:hypothetical protein
MYRTLADGVGKYLVTRNLRAWVQRIKDRHDDFASHSAS